LEYGIPLVEKKFHLLQDTVVTRSSDDHDKKEKYLSLPYDTPSLRVLIDHPSVHQTRSGRPGKDQEKTTALSQGNAFPGSRFSNQNLHSANGLNVPYRSDGLWDPDLKIWN
jgi:hypothetical protein